jgi:hypothetical protein
VPAPDAVPNTVPHALPLLRNGPEGSTWPPLAETVVIHPERDVDQTKGATADAVKGSYVDDHIYKMPLLPCTVPGWTCGDWHGRLLSHEIPWHAVVRQVRLGSI